MTEYTYGHCLNKARKGGCQLHNLYCNYPNCDRREVAPPTLPTEQVRELLAPKQVDKAWLDEAMRLADVCARVYPQSVSGWSYLLSREALQQHLEKRP